MSAGAKWIATHEPAQAEPHPSNHTPAFDAGRHVTRAGWLEATARTEQWSEQPLIDADRREQKRGNEPYRPNGMPRGDALRAALARGRARGRADARDRARRSTAADGGRIG